MDATATGLEPSGKRARHRVVSTYVNPHRGSPLTGSDEETTKAVSRVRSGSRNFADQGVTSRVRYPYEALSYSSRLLMVRSSGL
jgi:hypothetical protein